MLKFVKLKDKDIKNILKYTHHSKEMLCDYSAGVMFMWKEYFKYEYAIYNDMLILKVGDKNSPTFFPPVGNGDFCGAVKQIENYCLENEFIVKYSFLSKNTADKLSEIYKNYEFEVGFNRDYSDYLYNYQDIKNFTGKRYSGQRNHINSFKRLYPNYQYKNIEKKDTKRLIEFLSLYKKQHPNMKGVEKKEFEYTIKLAKNLSAAPFNGGYLEVDGKIVAISIGEYLGDMLIIHIEKGLKEYKGVYPTMFNEFVKKAEKQGVEFINREDDAGDLGLRTSKTQYHPCGMGNKHYFKLKPAMPNIKKPTLKGNLITLSPIKKSDSKEYFKLYTATKNNRYWNYDYKKFITDVNADTFYKLQLNDYKKRQNMCLAIKEKGKDKLIGEVVLYKFDYDNSVEVGIRLNKQYQNKGYGKEGIKLITDFVKNKLGLKVKARCFKENIPSYNMFVKSGFKVSLSDNKFYYFEEK